MPTTHVLVRTDLGYVGHKGAPPTADAASAAVFERAVGMELAAGLLAGGALIQVVDTERHPVPEPRATLQPERVDLRPGHRLVGQLTEPEVLKVAEAVAPGFARRGCGHISDETLILLVRAVCTAADVVISERRVGA